MSVGMLMLRVVVGLLFMGHGAQKLFGWFGGGGREGTAGFLASLGYRSPRLMSLVGGITEGLGGLLIAFGLFTPVGSALIVGMMVSAILVVHLPNGVWNQNGGIELPLVNIMAATAIAFRPGRYSLDSAFGIGLNGRLFGVLALSVGLLGAVVVTVTMRRAPEAVTAEYPAAEKPEKPSRAA